MRWCQVLRNKVSPTRLDRTRLATVRRKFQAAITKAWLQIKVRIRHLIITLDVLSLKPKNQLRFSDRELSTRVVTNDWTAAWAYETSAGKVKRFRDWLRTQMDSTLPGDALLEEYILLGFKNGLKRGMDQARKQSATIIDPVERKAFFDMARDEALDSLLGQQATIEKVKLLAGRTFTEMEDVDSRTATTMSRLLADGLVQGKTPEEIANDLFNEVDIEKNRALVIARTELTRAHAEGQLDAMGNSGIDSATAEVEWTTDGTPCPECAALEGKIFTLDEARGMIPVHPNCYCSWLPVEGDAKPAEED